MPLPLQAGLSNAAAAIALTLLAYLAVRLKIRPAAAHALWLLVLVKLLTPTLLPVPVAAVQDEKPETTRVVVFRMPTPARPLEVEVEYPIVPVATAVVTANDDPGTRGLLDPKTGLPLPPQVKPQHNAATKAVNQQRTTARKTALPIQSSTGDEIEYALTFSRASAGFPWWWALIAVWLGGTVVLLTISARRVLRFKRLLRHCWPAPATFQAEFDALVARMGFRRPPRLRLLPGAISPMVWAVGRLTIYFPAELLLRLTSMQRSTLLAHELAHLKRRDHWVRWMELAAVSLFWWLPIAWLARRGLHQAEEECCDAMVVATLPGSGRDYASALLDAMDFLAEHREIPAVASGLGEFQAFRRRLLLILTGADTSGPSRFARIAVVAAACAALPLAPTLATLPAEIEKVPIAQPPAPALVKPKPVLDPFAFEGAGALLPAPSERWAAIACSLDGRIIALGGEEGVITLLDLRSGKIIGVLRGHHGGIAALAFAHDGRLLASASGDRTIRIWDFAERRLLHTLSGHFKGVSSVAFSPDGSTLASTSYDRTVRLWRVRTGDVIAELRGHAAAVLAVTFSPDGWRLASASADRTIRVWDLLSDNDPLVLRGHQGWVRSVAFSPDGKQIASGSEDGSLRIWNAGNGKLLADLDHAEMLEVVAYSPGGTLLLSTTWAGQVYAWDAQTGRLRTSFQAHRGRAAAVVAPDGQRLITAGRDRTVRLWSATSQPPNLDRVVDEAKRWLDVFPPLACWLSLDTQRPGVLWSCIKPPTMGRATTTSARIQPTE